MRQCVGENKRADGPLGIRAVIWFMVFALLLLCVLTIGVSRHRAIAPPGESALENIADQDSSRRRGVIMRWAEHKNSTPEVDGSAWEHDEDGERQVSMIEQMVRDRRTWVDNAEQQMR